MPTLVQIPILKEIKRESDLSVRHKVGVRIGVVVEAGERESTLLAEPGNFVVDGGGVAAGVLLGHSLGEGTEIPWRLWFLSRILIGAIVARFKFGLLIARSFPNES